MPLHHFLWRKGRENAASKERRKTYFVENARTHYGRVIRDAGEIIEESLRFGCY